MTASTARTRSQPDWSALAASYHAAATADALASYRRRRWNFADQPQEWLTQGHLPSLTEAQALTLYRAAGGRHTAQFRTNPIAEVRDAADFLLYDTIKLESRFDECASPEGGFGLNGAGREWPSYLLTLYEPALFAPWGPTPNADCAGWECSRPPSNAATLGCAISKCWIFWSTCVRVWACPTFVPLTNSVT